MEKAYSIFAQSRFFTSAFNSAIYDGPIRIYFSQTHEAAGLSVYFALVKKHPDSIKKFKELSKIRCENLYVLIYPNEEIFSSSFGVAAESVKSHAISSLLQHRVVGIKSPNHLDQLESLVEELVEWIDLQCLHPFPEAIAEL